MKLAKPHQFQFCLVMLGIILTTSAITILAMRSEDDQEQHSFISVGITLFWISVLIWVIAIFHWCNHCMDLDNLHPSDDHDDLETDTIFREPTRIPQSNV